MTDNQYLDFWANGVRALRLRLLDDASGVYTNAPNVIGGSSVNLTGPGVVGAVIGGGGGNDVNGAEYANEAAADFATVGGGLSNTNLSSGGTIAGGTFNMAEGTNATIAGGGFNQATGTSYGYSTVGGGNGNSSGSYATVAGGLDNKASGFGSFIGGGGFDDSAKQPGNTAAGTASAIAGGMANTASGHYSTVAGGLFNEASSSYAAVPGGLDNVASGEGSFAAGTYAFALNDGAFVWADDRPDYDFESTAANGFFVRCSGGAQFVTAIDDSTGDATAGVKIGAGGASWSSICDRTAKKNFHQVDTVSVLNKLAAIPIQQWNYKWETDADVPNIGPMAQDFKAAFYPGRDDKSISTLEFDGVELAAIQGLNQKLNEKEAEIEKLKVTAAKVDSLEKQLNELRQKVQLLAGQK